MLLSPSLVHAGLLLLLAAPLHGRDIRFGAKALRVRRGLRGGAETETGCGPQDKGFGKEVLDNNTHKRIFNDLSGSVSLSWIGDSTGVILVLTTFQLPLVIVSFGQSKLYRSEDYGKTFTDITDLINNTFIRTEFGMAIGPENSGKVILTGDRSGSHHSGRIFRSSDFAKNFVLTDLPFHPLTQIIYHPQNSDLLLTLSTEGSLWISKTFGEKWKEIHKDVCLAKWGSGGTIFFTTYLNGSCKTDTGLLELKKTKDFGKTFKTIGNNIYSFGLGGRFLFASVMIEKTNTRRIHVSLDEGETWNMAQLPSVGQEQFYSILAANDDMVFMHVDEPGDTGHGTIYTSDDQGIIYSKSLERHLYTTTGGETDFTNITSLRGSYITSVLSEDNSIQSVITFDEGGEWIHLRKPENAKCDSTARNKEKCNLHIHASYSISQKLNVPMAPLTEPNAVGIIISHGSVGDAISITNPDVYISDDGGYTWARTLEGPHHYAILDSGGIIVAVEQIHLVKEIKFSTDEGQCWHSYVFSKEPIFFTGLASEPGAKSMNVSIWGFQESFLSHQWISYTIDFQDLLSRDCEEKDYTKWLAHSSNPSNPTDGCILGYKEEYRRLRKSSVCKNGRDYIVTKQPSVCICTLDDFLCDFGYFRPENQSECVEQPELKGHDLEFCLYGKQELLKTSGYRKIPGDKCVGGKNPKRKEIDLKQKCTSNYLKLSPSNPSSNSTPVILAIIALMLITAVAGVVIIKKYVCGGRFLVHRYSVLQQHAEANGFEGLDVPGAGKTGYHDDSDEDLLE